MTEHPVLTSYYYAYLDHYPIVLSPDILWMLILEGFSYHVRLNHKRLREKFVKNNQNKNKIIITQEANGDSHIIIIILILLYSFSISFGIIYLISKK